MNNCLLVSLLLLSAEASAFLCAHEKEIDQNLDLSGSEVLAIAAGAGDLVIEGVPGSDSAVIRGKVCVSEEEWLDESRVETVPGPRAEINVELPDVDTGWSLTGRRYARIDLHLEVPGNLALELRDGSGDIEVDNVASISVTDSSGDIDIDTVAGPVSIRDSSGDIEVASVAGDLTVVSDSSGDIKGEGIEGSAIVKADSSGDIEFAGVAKNVLVERDSSGDIAARDVGGDFSVLRDSTGEIRTRNISGEIETPDS